MPKVNNLYQTIFDRVWLFIGNGEDAQGLTNQLHYLVRKHGNKRFVQGMVLGAVGVFLLTLWLS